MITTDLEIYHTLTDAHGGDEKTDASSRVRTSMTDRGVGFTLEHPDTKDEIGDVYVEIYGGKLIARVWRDRDLGNDPVESVILFDFKEPHETT